MNEECYPLRDKRPYSSDSSPLSLFVLIISSLFIPLFGSAANSAMAESACTSQQIEAAGFKSAAGYPVKKLISARQPWVPTGIVVSQGRRLMIEAIPGETWSAHPGHGTYGANGWEGNAARPWYVFPGGTEGALVGKVGSQLFEPRFCGIVDVLSPGELFLSINDHDPGIRSTPRFVGRNFGDNTGAINVTITLLEPIEQK